MAIPSGSGTEVIKYHQVQDVTTTDVLVLPSPTANHIYTILSIVVTTASGANAGFNLRTWTDSGFSAGQHWIINGQNLTSPETFVWNEKFSFSGSLYLTINTNGSANLDVHTTYIDQDWT